MNLYIEYYRKGQINARDHAVRLVEALLTRISDTVPAKTILDGIAIVRDGIEEMPLAEDE